MYGKPPFLFSSHKLYKNPRRQSRDTGYIGSKTQNDDPPRPKTIKMSNTDPTTKNSCGKPVSLGRVYNSCVGKLENRGLKMMNIQSFLLLKTF